MVLGFVVFTFHYGSILIVKGGGGLASLTQFTFHYGSILMLNSVNAMLTPPYLHSTMVLF